MAVFNTGYEPFRTISIEMSFNGTGGAGATGNFIIDRNPIPFLDIGEFVYEVFYRVTTTLVSAGAATLELGITTDDPDCILTTTTGLMSTLNTNGAGFKLNPGAYTKSTVDGRELIATVGTADITAGVLEVVLVIARAEPITPPPTITS
jgi:hypothetical protein